MDKHDLVDHVLPKADSTLSTATVASPRKANVIQRVQNLSTGILAVVSNNPTGHR